jgi:hypothetical protein
MRMRTLRRSTLRRRGSISTRRGLLVRVLLAAGVATAVSADQAYHTQRLTLTGVNGAPGR